MAQDAQNTAEEKLAEGNYGDDASDDEAPVCHKSRP